MRTLKIVCHEVILFITLKCSLCVRILLSPSCVFAGVRFIKPMHFWSLERNRLSSTDQSVSRVTLFNRNALGSPPPDSSADVPQLSSFLLNSESTSFATRSIKMIS